MTTLNTTGQSVLDLISTLAWATGRTVHHGTNVYQGARRLYRNEIASGALRRDLFAAANAYQDAIDDSQEAIALFLTAWQSFSDDLRGLIWIVLGPVLTLLWGAACDVAMGMARTLGRVWGFWMAHARLDVPVWVLMAGARWVQVIVVARRFLRAAARRMIGVSDRAFQVAFALD